MGRVLQSSPSNMEKNKGSQYSRLKGTTINLPEIVIRKSSAARIKYKLEIL